LLAGLRELFVEDLAHIDAGDYAPPPNLPNPVTALRRAGAVFRDFELVNARRRAKRHQEVAAISHRKQFPRYYLQNFHYQTDGWLSRRSAELYDHQVEILFVGSADVMRRQALLPIARALGAIARPEARLIDIACGTGRFLREVKRNWPWLSATGLDLSPYYLDQARALLEGCSSISFIEAPAEAVPEPDASYDIATATFLFHELPPNARRAVAAEMAWLVKPGGYCVLVDSLQTGDRPEYSDMLERFPAAFHEPYYPGYLHEDLEALFGAAGFDTTEVRFAFLSKIVTFRRRSYAAAEA
jgi:ubiquinone/menaquinone biosynthesis C-methylase UbiE